MRRPVILMCCLMAAGCSTVPTAPPHSPPAEAVTTWEVLPPGGYSDEFGYVDLDFAPAGPNDPGQLTVHLGRRSLDHANTAWYRFTVTEGSTVLLSRSGTEGIPNIKGPDGNWWSTVDLELPEPVIGEVAVSVMDLKIGIAYTFTIRRLTRM